MAVPCHIPPSDGFGVVSHLVSQAMWQCRMTLCPFLQWRCSLLKLLKSFHLHANISAIVWDHSYLPTRFGGVVDALVYILGFLVRQVLRKLQCNMCCASLVKDTVPTSFYQSYHLLALKNNGGLVIPSEGTVRVVRAAEQVIHQASSK